MNTVANHTGLPVAELVKEIAVAISCDERGTNSVPVGRLVNDLGDLLHKDVTGAEEALIALLKDERHTVRFLSYAFLLKYKSKLTKISLRVLLVFESNASMSDIVEDAKAMLLSNN